MSNISSKNGNAKYVDCVVVIFRIKRVQNAIIFCNFLLFLFLNFKAHFCKILVPGQMLFGWVKASKVIVILLLAAPTETKFKKSDKNTGRIFRTGGQRSHWISLTFGHGLLAHNFAKERDRLYVLV